MSHISPMEKMSTDDDPKIMQRVKKRIHEDHDPWVLIGMGKLLQHKKLFKYIKIFLICVHVFGFIYSTQGKFRKLYNYNGHVTNAMIKFIDCLSGGVVTATNIIGLISFSKSSALYNNIFKALNNKSNNIGAYKRRFKRYMVSLHFLTILVLLPIICFMTIKIGWRIYQYLVAGSFEFYCFNLLVYAVLCFVQKIKEIFHDVNQSLLEIDQAFLLPTSNYILHTSNGSIGPSTHYLQRLKSITQSHNNICNLLDKFNEYFKDVLVLLVLCIILDLLLDCTMLIEYAVKPTVINGVDTNKFTIFIYPVLIFIKISQAALAALVGEHLAGEGLRTTVLCYSLLNKLPTHLNTETDQLIEKQINLLLSQSQSRNVSLHGGGFFKLDWGILGSIASTVATYTIVIIQFLLK